MKLTTRQMRARLDELEARKAREVGACVVRCRKCGTDNKVDTRTYTKTSMLHSTVSVLLTARSYVRRYSKAPGIAALAGWAGAKLWDFAARPKCYKCGTPMP